MPKQQADSIRFVLCGPDTGRDNTPLLDTYYYEVGFIKLGTITVSISIDFPTAKMFLIHFF